MGVGTEAKWAVGPKERKAHEQEKATRGRERAVSSVIGRKHVTKRHSFPRGFPRERLVWKDPQKRGP